ncbi:MAG: metal-dependent transcriptional regulator [bacterium]
MITKSIQDYLKIIYKIGAREKTVSTNAIAERLGVSQASVTGMSKKLAQLKLIRHKPYQGVELTNAGRKIALEIIRHHRLLELYLAEALGFSWDQVHDEAEKLEHVISEEFEDRMAEVLGDPIQDPHGAPIPTKQGILVERKLDRLTSVKAGQTVCVQQVSDSDPEMLRYLGNIGIFPNVVVVVLEKAPFDGPMLVQVGEDQHYLGRTLTNNIFISV